MVVVVVVRGGAWWRVVVGPNRGDGLGYFFYKRFNKIAIQGTPQMAVD